VTRKERGKRTDRENKGRRRGGTKVEIESVKGRRDREEKGDEERERWNRGIHRDKGIT
jgi:hypothetical protein